MANGDDFGGVTVPTWMRVLLLILKSQGVATVISLALVWFVMSVIWGGLGELKKGDVALLEAQNKANLAMSSFAAKQEAYDLERTDMLKTSLRINRQTCANSARNEFDRKTCWE